MPETETVDALVLDLLEWIGSTPRPYGEVLDAWRTSCPRLPVWEEANERGFVTLPTPPRRGRADLGVGERAGPPAGAALRVGRLSVDHLTRRRRSDSRATGMRSAG